ncbi:hypothetical protein HDU96_004311 [Phlyctochytrium bullatum]|nr:hypothetical protein HDU96_004311 [Phlyctochytrium bullatum]
MAPSPPGLAAASTHAYRSAFAMGSIGPLSRATSAGPSVTSGCFKVVNSVVFPELEGGYMRQTVAFNSSATLNDWYLSTFSTDADQTVKSNQAALGCPGYTYNTPGTVRYTRSVAIGVQAALAQLTVDGVDPCPGNPSTVKQLCRSTCETFKTTLNSLFSNNTACLPESSLTDSQKASRTSAKQYWQCDILPTNDCLLAIGTEYKSCGFIFAGDAVNYCKKGGAGELINDNCCLYLSGEFASAVAFAGGRGTFTPTVMLSDGGGLQPGANAVSPKVILIIGIAVPLVIVIFAVTALILIIRRRRGRLQMPLWKAPQARGSREAFGPATNPDMICVPFIPQGSGTDASTASTESTGLPLDPPPTFEDIMAGNPPAAVPLWMQAEAVSTNVRSQGPRIAVTPSAPAVAPGRRSPNPNPTAAADSVDAKNTLGGSGSLFPTQTLEDADDRASLWTAELVEELQEPEADKKDSQKDVGELNVEMEMSPEDPPASEDEKKQPPLIEILPPPLFEAPPSSTPSLSVASDPAAPLALPLLPISVSTPGLNNAANGRLAAITAGGNDLLTLPDISAGVLPDTKSEILTDGLGNPEELTDTKGNGRVTPSPSPVPSSEYKKEDEALSSAGDLVPPLPPPAEDAVPVGPNTPAPKPAPSASLSATLDVATWSAEKLAQWFLTAGFAQELVETLRVHKMNGYMLMHLTDEMLLNMGIRSPAARSMLYLAARQIRASYAATTREEEATEAGGGNSSGDVAAREVPEVEQLEADIMVLPPPTYSG